MELYELFTSGALASATLELLKFIVRRIMGKPEYDFPKWVYVVAIPLLNLALQPLLAFLGFEGFVMPTDWLGVLRQALVLLISSLISLGTYGVAIKPLKNYVRER